MRALGDILLVAGGLLFLGLAWSGLLLLDKRGH